MKASRPDVTLAGLRAMKAAGEKIACLTAYDASFAARLAEAGVDLVLVGDSLGMVVQGQESTLPVSVADMVYHARAVARAAGPMLRVVDMPHMSYASVEQAVANGRRLVEDGGAQMVKLEGGAEMLPVIRALVAAGIPVCGHLGLLPQSVRRLGGYRVQGREPEQAARIRADAAALAEAGVGLLVLECIPAALAADISRSLAVPTIGIGAGADCDGQVLVLYDLLGITPGRRPRFVRDFLAGSDGIAAALAAYVQAVKGGDFPGPGEAYG